MELQKNGADDHQPRFSVIQGLLSCLDGYFSWSCSLNLRQGQSQDTLFENRLYLGLINRVRKRKLTIISAGSILPENVLLTGPFERCFIGCEGMNKAFSESLCLKSRKKR